MTASDMPRIKQLPQDVVAKIAAGEVIERPAAAVKELVENALDAGATRIEVDVEDAGKRLIRVADDGAGILPEDLPLTVAGHCTSKLSTAEDLFAVQTMGFRGEALASIAAVSQFTIASRHANRDDAARLQADAGIAKPVEPCARDVGTTVEVRNLFLNVPVRRKFMKSTGTEMGHASEAIVRLALAHPEVALRLTHNRRTIHDLASSQKVSDRIMALFGPELADAMHAVYYDDGYVRIEGLVAAPTITRVNQKSLYFFVNSRFVRDRLLIHSVNRCYRQVLPSGRYPVVFLFLTLHPGEVDVNIHPTKVEIRFRNGNHVYKALKDAIEETFASGDVFMNARLAPLQAPPEPPRTTPPSADRIRQAIGDFFAATGRNTGATDYGRHATATQPGARAYNPVIRADGDPPEADPATTLTGQGAPIAPTTRSLVQMHNTFIIEETSDGILITDQHALHERILFERLRAQMAGGGVIMQRLLVPEEVRLTPREAAALGEMRRWLAKSGLAVEQSGPDTVEVRAVPQILKHASPEDMLREILAGMDDVETADMETTAIVNVLQAMACKGAVKAGQRLSPEELAEIMRQRAELGIDVTCPHGRPTSLAISLADLYKQFGRE